MCPCQAEINGKTSSAAVSWEEKWADSLTQVPSHQIGIVEILHAQSHDVDEFLYDLHELHCSRIDLDKIKKAKKTRSIFYKHSSSQNHWMDGSMECKIHVEEEGKQESSLQMHTRNEL